MPRLMEHQPIISIRQGSLDGVKAAITRLGGPVRPSLGVERSGNWRRAVSRLRGCGRPCSPEVQGLPCDGEGRASGVSVRHSRRRGLWCIMCTVAGLETLCTVNQRTHPITYLFTYLSRFLTDAALLPA